MAEPKLAARALDLHIAPNGSILESKCPE